MAHNPTWVLIPLLFAFVVFVAHFYGREGARSHSSFSFVMAIVTVLILMSALLTRVLDFTWAYAPAAYGFIGCALLVAGVMRFRG